MSEQVAFKPVRVLDSNGDPAAGAKAYFYITGTTTLEAVYTDETLATAHPSPLVADAQGTFAAVFHAADHALKVTVTDSVGAILNGYPIDPAWMTTTATVASAVTFTPITGNAATEVQTAIANNTAAALTGAASLVNQWQAPVTTGASNAYALAAASTITAYAVNQTFLFRAHLASTGAVTLNIDSLGAKDVQGYDGAGALEALASDEIQLDGIYRVIYDGTRFILLNRMADEVRRGTVEISTSAENLAGTAANVVPTVAGVTEIVGGMSLYEARAIMDGTGTPSFTVNNGFSATITDNGVGDYTVAFATAQPDANYLPNIWTISGGATTSNGNFCMPYDITTAGFSFRVTTNAGGGSAAIDMAQIFVDVQRI